MNVDFGYLYRDGGNNKSWGSVVFSNPDRMDLQEAANRLTKKFDQNEYFIASQIGIPERFLWDRNANYDPDDESTFPKDLGPGKYVIWDDMDHCWHEFDGLQPTESEPTDPRTLRQFVEEVERVENWKVFIVRTDEYEHAGV
jgi:hypothetical protein